eukprot:12925844-Prorocentrum_lima.AAC.1
MQKRLQWQVQDSIIKEKRQADILGHARREQEENTAALRDEAEKVIRSVREVAEAEAHRAAQNAKEERAAMSL